MKLHDPKLTGSIEIQNPIAGISPLTASWAQNLVGGGGPGGSTFPYTGSAIISGSLQVTGSFGVSGSGYNVLNDTQITGSLSTTDGIIAQSVTASFTGSLRGTLIGTSSWAVSASNSLTASFINQLNQNVVVTGSLTVTQNLTVLGTSSITYVTSSQLNIGTNLITVNTDVNTVRFGGLASIDSGSNPQQSGSLLYDSVQDEWIFVHRGASTSAVTSSHLLMGPETYNTVGDESYVPQFQLIRSVGNEHVTGSQISDVGGTVIINSPTQITGSLIISASSNIVELVVVGQTVMTGSLVVSGSGGYGVFSKGITVADLTNGFTVTGSYHVWRCPFPSTVVGVYGFKSGSANVQLNARRSGSGTSLHLASNLTITNNNQWTSGGAVQNTTYSAGDSLEIIVSGSSQYQVSVQVDYIKR